MAVEDSKTPIASGKPMDAAKYTSDFESMQHTTVSSDEEDRQRNLKSFGARDKKADIEIGKLKSQVEQAKNNLYSVRKNLHKHVTHDSFQELVGFDELFEEIGLVMEDIRARADARDASKPPKRLGPTDEVPEATVIVVETEKGVQTMLEQIAGQEDLHSTAPRIFVNCVGDDLGRNGKLTLLVVYIPEAATVFMVDILALGADAFSIPGNEQDLTIKNVLEDEGILKGMWDCRSISDALFAEFQVALAGAVEIQLLELATCKSPRTSSENIIDAEGKPREVRRRVLPSLEFSFNRLNLTEEAARRVDRIATCDKDGAREGADEAARLYSKACTIAKGEKYNTSADDYQGNRVEKGLAVPAAYARPIKDPMKTCWAQKTLLLPGLYHHFVDHRKYTVAWAEKVAKETENRLELSRSPDWKNDTPRALPQGWFPDD